MKIQEKVFFKHNTNTEMEIKFHQAQQTSARKNNKQESKLFSAADMWNIRRRVKNTLVR